MPAKLSRKDRNLLMGAGLVFVLLIITALLLSSNQQAQSENPSTYSAASGGAKAAYLVLTSGGYKVQRWEQPLSALPRARGQTLVLAEPNEASTREERERLTNFISEGGHVIATGVFAGTFLPENASVPDPLSGMTWKTASSVSPSRIARAAPHIVLAPRAYWQPFSAAYPLYGDGTHAFVVKYPYGRGEVLWWASATPLTNAGLKEPGNIEFFLACLGNEKSGGQANDIFWDEYIHGYRQTLAASIAHSAVKWLVLQLALLGLAVIATFSRRSGPLSAPVSGVRLSPMEFVETLGGLYQRADAASTVVDVCYRRFRYWLTRRLGVAGNISTDELAVVIHDRSGFAGVSPSEHSGNTGFPTDRFIATMKQCESAASDPFLHGPMALHLVQELDDYAAQLKVFQKNRKEKGR
jgi:hypothetical protein